MERIAQICAHCDDLDRQSAAEHCLSFLFQLQNIDNSTY